MEWTITIYKEDFINKIIRYSSNKYDNTSNNKYDKGDDTSNNKSSDNKIDELVGGIKAKNY